MKTELEEIKPQKLVTLVELFRLKIFRMPDYQRGYAWANKKESKQLNDLWNDLENISDEAFHFTGVVTLEKITQKSKFRWEKADKTGKKEFNVSESLSILIGNTEYTPYFVVDGQQRLVSLMILLSLLSKEDDLLAKKKEAQEFISILENHKTHYLFGYEKDTPSHEYLIGNIFEDKSMDVREPETLYTQNLTRAKEFFQKKLKTLDSFEKRRLFEKLTQKLLFNILEIESDKLDISLVFETLNYRGKLLSKLELFKNRLIFLITKRHTEKSTQLRKNVIETWLDIYEWLGKNNKNELDDDEFLRSFWIMFFNHSDRKDSEFKQFEQDIFEKKYKIADVKKNDFLLEYGIRENDYSGLDKLLDKLSEAVKYWFFIHNPDFEFKNSEQKKIFNYSDKIKTYLQKLLRNRYGEFMKPLILAYFVKFQSAEDFDKIEEFLKQVERHNYCVYLLAGWQADKNRAYFSRKVNEFFRDNISHNLIVAKIKDETDDCLKWGRVFDHIHGNRANNKGFWDWNGKNYTFWEWERYLQGESEPVLINFSKASTHLIFPDEGFYRRDNPFANIVGTKKTASLLTISYSLGNILISKTPRKPNSYEKMRENMLTGSYCDKDCAKNYQQWTVESIFQRGLNILNFIEKRWNVKYSDVPESDLQLRRKQLLLDGVGVKGVDED